MIKIVWNASFKQTYKKKISGNELLKKKFWNAMKIFEQNPYDTRLKTHKLAGKLDGFFAFSVSYDCRVIFKFDDDKKSALFFEIGSHEEIY